MHSGKEDKKRLKMLKKGTKNELKLKQNWLRLIKDLLEASTRKDCERMAFQGTTTRSSRTKPRVSCRPLSAVPRASRSSNCLKKEYLSKVYTH